jgi:hypothetical protein
VFLAKKRRFKGFLIADVSGDQSLFGAAFISDVMDALQRLTDTSDATVLNLNRSVKTIVRADIENSVEYYSRTGLLLLRVDYSSSHSDSRQIIYDLLVQFTSLLKSRAKRA